ncbi:MAG: GNAT family N-acetyltransferase [Bacteroidota bacterium]
MDPRLYHIDTALLTPRCVIRRFREGDGKPFHNLIQNNQTHLTDHFPHLVKAIDGPEMAEAFIRHRISDWLLQQEYTFGIWENESTEMIGYVHLFHIDWDVPIAEISYFLDREASGNGIMTEVLARVVRFAFLQLEVEKLFLTTLADNYASQRVAKRVGFQREGDLRNEFRRPGGTLVDLVRLGFTRETYGE